MQRNVRKLMAMRLRLLVWVGLFLADLFLAVTTGTETTLSAEPPSNPPRQTAWTQSRLQGSPEPPLPYVLEPAFDIEFNGPVSLNRIPLTSTYLVCEERGKVYYFDGSQPHPDKYLCFDFNAERPASVAESTFERIQLLSLTYHPDFASNRWVFVCFVTQGGGSEPQTHISRFKLSAEQTPQLEHGSELPILKCGGGGHNGCTLAFGKDGFLYISIGDLEVPNPPDPRDTGQDISDLYAAILRIDVDRSSHLGNYSIPPDNPFVKLSGARAEVYAYGLRNPFRMSFDEATGDLWVGDVGWEAWEMVYRVRPGGNYGWAIKEGPGDVKPQSPGPTPILPADIALNHADAASVTGGLVYRGKQYADLAGQYIFGDWITRRFWAARFDSQRVLDYREIAVGRVKPICFESDEQGELLIMDYSEANQPAGIFRLRPNPAASSKAMQPFPIQLSQSGLFENVARHTPAAGVYAYRINAPMWADGAHAEYLVGVPDNHQAQFYDTPQKMFDWFKTHVELPVGSVLVKTYSLGTQADPQRIETQLAIKDQQGDWQYYSYRWNEAGTDATLVASAGAVVEVPLRAVAADLQADQQSHQSKSDTIQWHFASRSSCRVCHTPWTGETLGFIEPQLRAPHHSPTDSWRELWQQGLIHLTTSGQKNTLDVAVDQLSPAVPVPHSPIDAMVDPQDATQSLDRRARAYLHTNCGHCHLNGGNASTTIDVSYTKLLADTRMVQHPPMRGDLGLSGAKIISPGRPADSLLFVRLAKTGAGRMPHIGSQHPDPLGTHLIKQWIAQLPREQTVWTALDELCAPQQANLSRADRLRAAGQLLQSYDGAVELCAALGEGRVPDSLVRDIVAAAQQQPMPVRELLEAYAAPDQRPARLGNNFSPESILSLVGSAEVGKQLFAQGVGTCSSCHRLEGIGKEVGPDLARLPLDRKELPLLLRSIMQPSAEIDERYRGISVVDAAGQVVVGRLVDRTATQLILQDSSGRELTIATDDIEAERKLPTSLMPEELLSSLTAQQAADLLAYLNQLK